jgi:hypothetical protein
MTIKEEMEIAKKTCTALDLTKQLDKLKSDDGGIDYVKVDKLISQLREFGPYYEHILYTVLLGIQKK